MGKIKKKWPRHLDWKTQTVGHNQNSDGKGKLIKVYHGGINVIVDSDGKEILDTGRMGGHSSWLGGYMPNS